MPTVFLFNFALFLCFKSINCLISADVDVQDLTNNEKIENSDELLTPKFGVIFPNTKWCGTINKADNYDDLGTEVEADRCCRDHHHCPDIIPAYGTKHNLTNKASYPRFNCDCDYQLLMCLRSARTKTANYIGVIYFDGILTKCYRKEFPVIKCIERGGWMITKCIEYEYDTSGEKVYQWFDEPKYYVAEIYK